MRVVVVEPFFDGSHRAWAEGWHKHSRHDVAILHHEAAFWRWRMRGSAVTFAEQLEGWIAEHGVPDVIVASDMVDLSSLLGLCRGFLSGEVPVVLYMHENQLTHPLGPAQAPEPSLGLINWKSMLAADEVWFNSEYHRDDLFAALPTLLGHMPDQRHSHLIDSVMAKSRVEPVGVSASRLIASPRTKGGGVPRIVWNQRWDHDKNPEAVLRALVRLANDGVNFTVGIAGENQRVDPKEFDWARQQLGDRIISLGWLPRNEYLDLLLASDVVISAARHEFFGVAIVEAIAAGAVPVLPNRLSYPEIIGPRWPSVLYGDGELGASLRRVVIDVAGARSEIGGLRQSMARFDWSVVGAGYDAGVERVMFRTER